MALIDVSDLLLDPDFCDSFEIIRREQTIVSHGRATENDIEIDAYGSVQAASGKTLEMFPDLARAAGQIEIYTKTRLITAAEGFAADRILWHDDYYTVVAIRDWSNYGAGFYLAVASLLPFVETPPGY